MAIIQGSFYSETLHRLTNYTAILPDADYEEVTVMYLLHGRSGDCRSWLNQTRISSYVSKIPLVVFCPEVGLSCYSNMAFGGNYQDFLEKEFPKKMKQFHSYKVYQTVVSGNSMGGYGALKWALAEPERFDLIGLLSPLADLRSLWSIYPESMKEFQAVFQSEELYEGSENDLFTVLVNTEKNSLPPIIHSCGEQDFLHPDNLKLQKVLAPVSQNYQYNFSGGDHNWNEWDQRIQDIIEYLKQSGG
ncbi:alpha/beta hydrolase [Enterococcus sp. CWB-B31]|uniref:alpha/beta hydrolase n=1 Tax=Enterococcus sp. CWB-B31 TaxID=2885159 RepID=UPI001E523272|nr:alpha/beta hydrolase-fold protein [Enterococcus sp. CWB-B31]MCB5953854.1 hypothetical protein [Enterococcus sp. CWB-B31]